MTNNSTGAVTGGSTTSFVNGPLIWQLATGSNYTYPIGKGSTYLPFAINASVGTTPRIRAEAFTGSAGGTATSPLGSLSTTEYWQATVASGTYTNGSVSLTRQSALGGLDAIGRSATQGGAYSSLNGSVSGTSIINSDNTGNTLGFFVMGQLSTSPLLAVTPTSLNFGFVASGSTSSEMTYALSGINLTGSPGNITVTAPSNFQVSLSSGSGFGSSFNVPYSTATLASTTIYVRFQPTSPNTNYSGNITNAGGGATTQNVAVTGNSNITYCTASAGGNTGITAVTFNTINRTSAGDESYTDQTAISTNVTIGQSYNISVGVNVPGGNNYVSVFFDWNQDGDFDDANERNNIGNRTTNGTIGPYAISILAGANLGQVRMRLASNNAGYPASCGTWQYGEIEDYTVVVQPAVTITTNPLSAHSYCPGSSITVPYSTTGTFNPGNVFSVQLSDASGSFGSPTPLSTISSGSGTITATLSSGNGSNYRVRVISSDPYFEGTDNGTDISIGSPNIITSPGSQCKYGETVDVTVSASSSLTGTFRWYDSGYTLLKTETSVIGSSYDANGISATTTYYVTFESGGCTTPYTEVKAYAIIPPSLEASAGGSFCVGTNINLYSDGVYDNIYWDGPNSYYSTLEDPVITNATLGMSGTYTVYTNTLSGVNLVINGNFEDGNTGFSSSYGYVAPTTNALWPEGLYTIVDNPTTAHDNFISCGDHTTGSGLQMVINGATTSGVSIWSQTVNVAPDTYYQFTYWVQSVVGNNPSQLQLFVNGTQAGPTYTAQIATCNWTQFLYNWDSGTATTAILELRNQNIVAGGNDFALDDIVFQHTCTAEASVDVYVSAGFDPDVIITVNPSETICDGSNVTFTATPLHGGATPVYQWKLNGGNVGSNSATYSNNSLITGDQVTCEMTSSLTGCLVAGSNPATSNTIQITVNTLPTITSAGTIATVGFSTDPQTATLVYLATSDSPTSYLIDWDAAANTAGLADQGSTAFPFAAGGGTVNNITITANTPSGTYAGIMTLTNDNGCTTTLAVTVTVSFLPTITTNGTIDAVCFSSAPQTTLLEYSATTSNPTSYSIDWDAAANTAGLADQGSTAFSFAAGGGTINTIDITANTPAGTYSGIMTIDNGNTNTQAVTVTINPNAAIALTSDPVTNDQTICINTLITPITYTVSGGGSGAGVGINELPAGVSAVFNSCTFTISGTPTQYGVFNYTVTTTGTCQQVAANGSITVNAPYVTVSSAYIEDCPQLIEGQGFNPNNSDYDSGATLVTFTVTLNGTAATNWSFDYIIEDAEVRTAPYLYPSPNPQNGTDIQVTGTNNTNLTFYINNVPGNQITPVLKITKVNDEYNCEDLTDRISSVNIKAMPVVGVFN